MSTAPVSSTIERIFASVGDNLTPDFAERLVKLRPDPLVELRLEELAEKSTGGQLSDEERAEYESVVLMGDLISVLQARARHMLAQSKPAA
jgi:hypothetical protein